MEDLNASNHEYSIPINVWNDKLTDLYKASRTRDKLFVVMTVMQLICLSVAVAFIVMHFNGDNGQKGEQGRPGESGKKWTCLDGREQYMGSCYYFHFRSRKTWSAANDDCHRKGGFLLKIDNAVENWFLKTYIKYHNPNSVWIGAHDSEQESNFIWESDNTNLTFTDWFPGEPNDDNNEDCVHMRKSVNYRWNDYQCSERTSYICEKK
ncbi:perlucin-like protein [Mytilus californianus]|uniref:perlucin-like protein n=1 Tax=Mytilus californianus TaxID=6549 RepID=UPI002247FB2E|nr:perlucin-like protein [Mytilus californianus]